MHFLHWEDVCSPQTLNTYPNSSLSSFLVASKGTFRTSILELLCFVAVTVLRCVPLSLKDKIKQVSKLTNCLPSQVEL